jgi:imidazolonepropionase-like amidohydrolase
MRKTPVSGSARIVAAAGAAFLAALLSLAAFGESDVRSGDRLASVLTGARVIAAPGRVFDRGVVVVRGGVVEAVGAEGKISIPADARLFDLKGKVVHAAYLDPYVSVERLAGRKPRGPSDEEEPSEERTPAAPRRARGPADHPLASVHAADRAIDNLIVADRVSDAYRRLGYAVVAAAPSSGILRGREAVVSLAEGPLSGRIVVADGFPVVSLDPEPVDFGSFGRLGYPVSKMGAVALVRQSFLDAQWWGEAEAAYARMPAGQARPRFVSANAALLRAAQGKETVVFEASDVLSLLRAVKIAREAKLRALVVGAGDEYRLRDRVAAGKPDLVLRVDFPQPDKVDDEVGWLDTPLERLRAIDRAPSNPKWMRDAGLSFSLTTAGLEDPESFPARVRQAIARGLSKDDALAAVTTIPARQLGLGDRLGEIAPGRIANLAVETGEPFASGSRVSEIWIDGKRYETRKSETGNRESKAPEPEPAPEVRPLPARDDGPVAEPKAVVMRGATVWTQGPAGILENADVVVSGGKIVAVGRGLAAPAGALEIDGRGKHVTPGIVDAHSHTAIDGQVNEFSNAVTAEVRIRDVLDPFEVGIYRELAGGTTAANVLHGSANSIGGQNAIVKWRRGGGPDDLLLAGAPEGIKFALGENPKRSNFQQAPARYPQTRMGVAAQIRERFLAARDYRKRQEEYRRAPAGRGAIPPRPDLQLEAIAEILEGRRKIHCHSYVKSEILQMIRTAEEFGVKVATFQHSLEGYKIADEIAKHGAGASIFSDWWAYKFEVYDAIPYAGPLMRDRGVVVSYNSDSDELARRLNTEAAKAVKYGGVPPADALAFVTSNPAKQLGVFDRIGSLEAGKDADFVVWSKDPLASDAVALETWIDGRKYFDRAADVARRPALERERADLVAKAKKMLERGAKPEAGKPAPPATTRPPEEPELRPTPAAPAPVATPTPAPPRRRS